MFRTRILDRVPRGVASIPIVLVLLSSLALLVGAVGKLALQRNQASAAEGYDKRARYAAYAGCQYGLLALGNNVSWAPGSKVILPLPDDPETYFELEVFNNYDGGLGATYTAPDGTEVPEGFAFLRSLGVSVQGSTSYNTSVSGLAARGDRFFNHAAVGHDFVRLNNSSTDAWNSYHFHNGNPNWVVYHHYNKQDPSGTGPDPNPNSEPGRPSGNIVTNGITPGAITLLNDSQVAGTPIVGPLGDPTTILDLQDSSATTEAPETGTSIKRIPRNRPPVNPTEATSAVNVNGTIVTLAPGAYTSLSVTSGGTLRLEENGIYMFTGDVVINDGTVNVDFAGEEWDAGPAFVYFGQNATIENGSRINEDAVPQRFQMFSMGNGQQGYESELRMSSNSKVWGIMSGRAMVVNFEDSELYGAVKGQSVSLLNSSIHYDRQLHSKPQGGLSAWKLLGVLETDKVEADTTDSGGAAGAAAAAAAGPGGAAGAAGAGGAAGPFGGGDAAAGAAAAAAGDAAGGDAASGGDAAGDAAAGDAAAAGGPPPGDAAVGGAAGDAAAAAAAAAAGGDAAGGDAAGGDACAAGDGGDAAGDAAVGGDAAGKGGDAVGGDGGGDGGDGVAGP